MLPRRKLRELAIQVLYSFDFNPNLNLGEILTLFNSVLLRRVSLEEVKDYMMAPLPFLKSIDADIVKAIFNYKVDRISRVEYAILRFAVFELNYCYDRVPPKVVIAEAVRLSGKFGTKEGGKFVHAILDAIYQKSPRLEEVVIGSKP